MITPPGCAAHVRDYLVRVTDLFVTHDLDLMIGELLDPEVVWIDHRPLGADRIEGYEASRAWLQSIFELMPDWRIRIEVLRQDGDTYVAKDEYSGEHGGAFGATALEWYVVDRLRDGRLLREDIFAEAEQAFDAFAQVTRSGQ